jgi:hypothetical protein
MIGRDPTYTHSMLPRETRQCAADGCTREFEIIHTSSQRYCSYKCSNGAPIRDIFVKKWQCVDGCMVRSSHEVVIDNWLHSHGVIHRYEPPMQGMRPDWLVGGTYIEYWGLAGKPDYDAKIVRKRSAYKDAGAQLLELYPEDLSKLDEALAPLLKRP